MALNKKTLHVLMFPWLAHGHISPYLELAKRLANRNFIIHICSTPANLSSIKQKIGEKYGLTIRLVELHLPTRLLPSCYHTTNGLSPDLMPKLKLSLDMAKPQFSKILASIKPDLLIYDFLQPWSPLVATSYGVPAVEFMTNSVTMAAYMFHFFVNPKAEFPFEEIHYRDYELVHRDKLMLLDDRVRDNAFQGVNRSSKIVLIKGFNDIELKYSGYLEKLLGKKVVQVGALVQEPSQEFDEGSSTIFEWLDKKRENSTVFVSFGSEYFLKREDMFELALGLELSNLNFIWVVRFPKGGERKTLEESLPLGFLGRVGDRGMVVEGWAPQAQILGHGSIGGFVSHCGCSSMMESMKFGVPIIAMPMHLDQPLNARLVEKIGVGVEVVRDGLGRLNKKAVAAVVRMVVAEGGGEAVRTKARSMSEKMKANGEEEIDEVVQEIVKLFSKKKRNGFY